LKSQKSVDFSIRYQLSFIIHTKQYYTAHLKIEIAVGFRYYFVVSCYSVVRRESSVRHSLNQIIYIVIMSKKVASGYGNPKNICVKETVLEFHEVDNQYASSLSGLIRYIL